MLYTESFFNLSQTFIIQRCAQSLVPVRTLRTQCLLRFYFKLRVFINVLLGHPT